MINILIIGRGSIGRQHKKNLKDLSREQNISVYQFEPKNHGRLYFQDIKKAIRDKQINAVIICNPTIFHLPTVEACLSVGAHVFVEKPISARFDRAAFARVKKISRKKGLVVMIGYDMRFNPWLKKIKELLGRKIIGNIWGSRIVAGQFLPSWRSGRDYRQSYSGRRELGGGVLADLSHELDYLTWFSPKKIARATGRLLTSRRLEINTEAISSFILEYRDGSIASVHLDYLNVPYRRSVELYGEKGTLIWDDNEKTLKLYTFKNRKGKNITVKNLSQRQILKEEMNHFLRCVKTRRSPINNLANAEYLAKIMDKVRQSSINRKTINF